MILGRDYRKLVAQTFAFAAYRLIAIWLIVAFCASIGPTGRAIALGIVALDIVAQGCFKAINFQIIDQSRKDWLDRLTNRCFYKLFWDEIRAGNASYIDIDGLFRDASKAALADINKAEAEASLDAGFLDKTSWHWFGGLLSFLNQWVSALLYYGSAIVVGGGL